MMYVRSSHMKISLFATATTVLLSLVPINQGIAQAVPTLPACSSADSDSDGDGFGWENEQSCRVVTNVPGQAVGILSECDIRRDGIPFNNVGVPMCLDNNVGEDLLPDLQECEDLANRWNVTCRESTNLVRNGTFDNGDQGWNTFLHPDSVAGPFVANGSVRDGPFASEFTFREGDSEALFSYRDAGTEWYHSQLFTDPISLEGGRTYRLSFSASTNPSGGDPVGSVVVENGTDFTKYLDRHDFTVGTLVFRHHYAEFFVPASDNNARVTFNLGDNYGGSNSVNVGHLTIDDVRLIALDTNATQQNFSSDCDYSNALIHGGWGWDPVALESCPPRGVQPGACVDSDGDGWGWDGVQSCLIQ